MVGTIVRILLSIVSLSLALFVVPFLRESPGTIFLFELVVVGGLLLFWVGRRFFLLRLQIWQMALIALALGVGLWFGMQPVRYHDICCMFGYTVGQGYPFVALRHGIILDTFVSPGQVDAIMQLHPNQVWWEIIWYKAFSNGLFYAYACLILIIGLENIVSLFRRPLTLRQSTLPVQERSAKQLPSLLFSSPDAQQE